MKSKTRLSVFTIRVFLIFSLTVNAQPFPSRAGSASALKSCKRPLPFHGMVPAVDQKKMTFTISGKEATRVFKVTSKTQVIKGPGIATMKGIVDNEEVSGAYWKNGDSMLEAKIVKLDSMEKKTANSATTFRRGVSPKKSACISREKQSSKDFQRTSLQ